MANIISLTPRGQQLAQQLVQLFPDAVLHHKPKPFTAQVQQLFQAGKPLIMICATGIVVRTLAPVLQNKHRDPPVLVLDEAGQYVIPLLSGHEGGANRLADQVAIFLSAQAVITTARPYIEPMYTVGMGCERHCPAEHLAALLQDCLDKAGLTLNDVASINSIALKANEIGLIELAAQVNKPFQTWSATELGRFDDLLSIKSDYILRTVGVYGVAEPAALMAAEQAFMKTPVLVLNKQKTQRATCAIASVVQEPTAR